MIMLITFLSIAFLLIILFVIIFQLALVFGAPWGEYTMGGRFTGKLPLKIRVAVLFQIFILILFAFIVLAKTQLAFEQYYTFGSKGIWFIVGFFVLGSILNLATPSKKERNLWGPVNLIALAIGLILAFGN
jgi:hypothetical protein